MNSAIFKHLAFFLIFLLASCGQPSPEGYVEEASKSKDKIKASEINFEIKLINSDAIPVSGVKITAKTSVAEETAITNDNGVTRLSISRTLSEPIFFNFNKLNVEANETVRSLPTDLKDAGIVFQMISPDRVKVSHYTVEGLYR